MIARRFGAALARYLLYTDNGERSGAEQLWPVLSMWARRRLIGGSRPSRPVCLVARRERALCASAMRAGRRMLLAAGKNARQNNGGRR